MFKQFDLLEYLNISKKEMLTFIQEIAKRYQLNAYHNFTHAFSLTQVAYTMINTEIALLDIFDRKDMVAILIAGLGHDIDHRKFLPL